MQYELCNKGRDFDWLTDVHKEEAMIPTVMMKKQRDREREQRLRSLGQGRGCKVTRPSPRSSPAQPKAMHYTLT